MPEAIKPARRTSTAQQRNCNAFRHEYNEERPHEALGQETPASRCRHSLRPYPERLPAIEYLGHYLVKKTTTGGTFRFRDRLVYLVVSGWSRRSSPAMWACPRWP